MLEATRPASVQIPPVALGVNVYAEVVTAISAVDVGGGRVVLRVGDEIQAVQLVGTLDVLRSVVTASAGALGRIARGGV